MRLRSFTRPEWPAIVLAIIMLHGTALAQSRHFVGARNLAMGGTGVGSASGAVAVYYNPAGMAFSTGWEFQLPLATLDVELEGDTPNQIDELQDVFDESSLREIQGRLDSGTATPEDLQTVLNAFLNELPDLDVTKDGALLRVAVGPSFRWKNWGVSAAYFGSGGVDTIVDLTTGLALSAAGIDGAIPDPVPPDACGNDPVCLAFADDLVQETGVDAPRAEVLVAAAGDVLTEDPLAFEILTDIVDATIAGAPTLAENPSGVITTGILTSQVAGTYSRLIYREMLSVGVNVKVLSGKTSFDRTIVADIEDGKDVLEDAFEEGSTKTETELGLDVGIMYRPTTRWSFGLVAYNVNGPDFDLSMNAGSLELEPLFRAGVAYRPLRWFNAAFDFDLNEIGSGVIPDFDLRYATLGAEFLIGKRFFGRLGAYRNLSFDKAETIYSGGLGFGLRRFSIELAVAAAADQAKHLRARQ